MEPQRQRVQMAEYLERDGTHRALRHLGEQEFAQLGEQRRRKAQRAVGGKQRQWQNELGRSRQAIDDLLQHQRHADIGELGRDEARQRQEDAAPVGEQIRQQRAHRAPVAPKSAIGGCGKRNGRGAAHREKSRARARLLRLKCSRGAPRAGDEAALAPVREPFVSAITEEAHREAHDAVSDPDCRLVKPRAALPVLGCDRSRTGLDHLHQRAL